MDKFFVSDACIRMLYLPWQSANPYHAAYAKIEFADMLSAQDRIGTCKLYPSMIEMKRRRRIQRRPSTNHAS
jgi:hypothetical protein